MTSTDRRAEPGHDVRQPGRWLALSVLVLAVLLVAVDATVLGLATPFLSEDLKPSGPQLLWIGDIYSFVIAGLLVSMGSLGDRIGRKRLLLCGAVAFGAVSVLNAYASSPEMMIFARALLGVAGATLMPSTLALIRNIFHDPRERSLAVGIWGAAASAGAAVGPVVGGFLLENFWWGSVFLINLPVMAVLVLVGIKLLPESRDPNPGPWDVVSVLLSLVGMVAIVYAVKEAAANGFGLEIAGVAAVGVLALVWFVRRQLTLDSPLLDIRLFHHRGFSGAVLADLLTILGLSGLVFFLSQFLQLVQGRSPLEAGLIELPAAVGAVGAGLAGGPAAPPGAGGRPGARGRGAGGAAGPAAALGPPRGSVRSAVAVGLAAVGAALAACVAITADTGVIALGIALFVGGLGAGLAFTVTADVILSSVPKEQAGAASAVSETAYELGAALGIALLGSVVTGIYRGFEAPAGLPAGVSEEAHDSLGGAVESAARLPAEQAAPMLSAARDAFTDGFQTAAAVGSTVLFATAVAAWFLLRGQRLEEGLEHP
ncbi:MFS transporter [Streptomyces sp. NPDC059991]|uniref:MFS transporter n=1 Tax=Streptomyces sp. NPDC059991 TaxID=3347028 RepID=UPI00367DD1BE